MKNEISVVITDFDNTLYDWVKMWHAAFSSMLDRLVEASEVPRNILEEEIQQVFQRHGTSEYAFLIEELPSLRTKHLGEDLTLVYQDAIDAYRTARKTTLSLYPGVPETLHAIKQAGSLIVTFTESMEFYSIYRFKKLELDGVIDFLYSPADHDTPAHLVRKYSDEHYALQGTTYRRLPRSVRKPNPELLLDIVRDCGINADLEKTIYVGDSLMKDIAMAQDAGILDVFAAYGIAQHTQAYEQLRRVTHWNKEDVEREKAVLSRGAVVPTYVLENSFTELLELFSFVQHRVN